MKDEAILQEIRRTIEMETDSIGQLSSSLNMETMVRVVKSLASCRGKIFTSGCGTSAMAAKKIAHSLCCIERPAVFMTPSDAVHGSLGALQSEDILILISKGGNTSELAPLASACKKKGAMLISVTENPDSILGKSADICLMVKVEREPCRFNMLATSSTLAVISTFDSICIALMEYTGYTKEQFAVIHPAGAVGERLLNKKEDS